MLGSISLSARYHQSQQPGSRVIITIDVNERVCLLAKQEDDG